MYLLTLRRSFHIFRGKRPQKKQNCSRKRTHFSQTRKVALSRGNYQCFKTLRFEVDQKHECMFTPRSLVRVSAYKFQRQKNIKSRGKVNQTTIHIQRAKIWKIPSCLQKDRISNRQSFTERVQDQRCDFFCLARFLANHRVWI